MTPTWVQRARDMLTVPMPEREHGLVMFDLAISNAIQALRSGRRRRTRRDLRHRLRALRIEVHFRWNRLRQAKWGSAGY